MSFPTITSILISTLSVFAIQAQEHTLNANWQFAKSEATAIEAVQSDAWEGVSLPHTWNVQDSQDEPSGYFRGTGWYKKELYIDSTAQNQLFLKFEGVNQVAEVFVNGTLAGKHIGGYSSFVIDISTLVKWNTHNEIAVRVNNSHDLDIPPLDADFTFYGGIYRDVWLVRKKAVAFDLTDGSTKGVYIHSDVSTQKATVHTKSAMRFFAPEKRKITLTYTLYNAEMQSVLTLEKSVKVKADEQTQTVQSSFSLENPQLWSPENPYLYTLEAQIKDSKTNELLDVFTEKVGFRWFALSENYTLLFNGKPLKLIGGNRHQDFAGLGNALSDDLHRKDIELVKAMGSNFVRLAHYPQDPAVLEACDELGLLVWEEIPIVNVITPSDAHTKNSIVQMQEMIRQHYNHPSMLMWGIMNEIMNRPQYALRDIPGLHEDTYYKAINTLALTLDSVTRAEDPRRFVALAHNGYVERMKRSGLDTIPDILGWNKYYGWYGGIEGTFDGFESYLKTLAKDYPGKGHIISEYGAGSDPRIYTDAPYKFDFSVEYQTLFHAAHIKQLLTNDDVIGGAVWNTMDFGSEHKVDAVPRINSKGLLTYDRKPKDSYLLYQAALLERPYLRIGNLLSRNRKGVASDDTLTETVYFFSNQDEIEVVLNGKIIDAYPVNDFYAAVEIPFRAGENVVEVKTANLTDTAIFSITIIPEQPEVANDLHISMNIGSHVHFREPYMGKIWIPERAYKKGSFGYVGGKRTLTWDWKVGVASEVDNTDLEPVYQTQRDSIQAFKADVPNGWYEITYHFAELYAKEKRESMAFDFSGQKVNNIYAKDRAFEVQTNDLPPLVVRDLRDFTAYPIKTKVKVKNKEGIHIRFIPKNGSAILNGIEIKKL